MPDSFKIYSNKLGIGNHGVLPSLSLLTFVIFTVVAAYLGQDTLKKENLNLIGTYPGYINVKYIKNKTK